MPGISEQVAERLEELYERHLPVDEARLDRYYDSRRGYYPPAEAGEERDRFAICLATVDGEIYTAGDHEWAFPLHSISKVFSYALALADHRREDVLARVGVSPSGDSFNSIVFDERNHRPYNAMVNAGALVTSDMVRGASAARKAERIVDVMRLCAGELGSAFMCSPPRRRTRSSAPRRRPARTWPRFPPRRRSGLWSSATGERGLMPAIVPPTSPSTRSAAACRHRPSQRRGTSVGAPP
jgi:hypothetical protein